MIRIRANQTNNATTPKNNAKRSRGSNSGKIHAWDSLSRGYARDRIHSVLARAGIFLREGFFGKFFLEGEFVFLRKVVFCETFVGFYRWCK